MDFFDAVSQELDELGENEVRERLAYGSFSSGRKKETVHEWLRRKDEEHTEARASLRDAREEETLSISKESKEIAERALAISERDLATAERASKAAERQARYAMYAAVIAIIAALIASKEAIIQLLP